MAKKVFKIAIFSVAIIVVCLQFVPAPLPETKTDNEGDIIKIGRTTEEVALILKTSCYDCHSNQTVYPWYSFVAPVSWLIKHDIDEGRKELNFSEWNTYNKRKALKKLDEISEVMKEGEMPLPMYTRLHRNAILNDQQKKVLIQWTKQEGERIINE